MVQISANDPNFDGLVNIFNQLGLALHEFEKISKDKSIANRQKRLNYLIGSVEKLSQFYDKRALGNDLRIIGAMIESLKVIASANALEKGAPSFFIGLSLALSGIFTSEGRTGIIGPFIEKLLKTFSQAIVKTFLSEASLANQRYFELLMTATFIGLFVLITWLSDEKNGVYPGKHPADKQSNQLFSFELAGIFLVNTGFLEDIYTLVASTCGAKKNREQLVGKIVSTVVLLWAILATATNHKQGLKTLVLGLSDPIFKGLSTISSFLNDGLQSGNLNRDAVSGWNMYIQQAQMALKQENVVNFISAMDHAFASLNITPEALQKDLYQIKEYCLTLINGLLLSADDHTNTLTGIAHSA